MSESRTITKKIPKKFTFNNAKYYAYPYPLNNNQVGSIYSYNKTKKNNITKTKRLGTYKMKNGKISRKNVKFFNKANQNMNNVVSGVDLELPEIISNAESDNPIVNTNNLDTSPESVKQRIRDIMGIDNCKLKESDNHPTRQYLFDKIKIEKGLCDLVIGNVQSGKTAVMIGYCFKSIFNTPEVDKVIFLVRNIESDLSQLESRIKGYNRTKIINRDFFFKPMKIHDLSKNVHLIENTNIIITLMNKASIIKCMKLITDHNFRYNICIDEIDLISGDTTETEKELIEIVDHPRRHHILGTTATPMATIMSAKINRIHKLSKADDYIGILDPNIKWHEVAALKSRGASGYDEKMEIATINTVLSRCEPRKLCIALLLSSVETKHQTSIIESVLKENPEWCGIVFNQRGISILRHGRSEKTFKVTISKALSYLIDKRNIRKIVIAAGKKADRGISFVDSKYKYHLTDLYIRHDEKDSGHCESLIQSLRILGRYKETELQDTNLHIWTTNKQKENIIRCQHIIEKYTDTLCQATNSGRIIKTIEDLNREFRGVDVRNKEVPKINLTKKRYYKENRLRWLDQEFLDKAELNDSLGIKYDKATDGWTLINPPEVGGDLGCHHNNHNCLKVVNEILGKLESRTKLKLLNKTKHKMNYYIPNVLTDEDQQKIKLLKINHLTLLNGKDSDIVAAKKVKKELQDYIKTKVDEFYKSNILTKENQEKLARISTQIKQLHDVGEDILHGHLYSYMNINKSSTAANAKIKNTYYQVTHGMREHINEETNIFERQHKGAYYENMLHKNCGTPFFYDPSNIENNNVPIMFDLIFPIDFRVGKTKKESIIVKSPLKMGDIIYWQNMEGQVFVNVMGDLKKSIEEMNKAADDLLRTFQDETRVVLQLNPLDEVGPYEDKLDDELYLYLDTLFGQATRFNRLNLVLNNNESSEKSASLESLPEYNADEELNSNNVIMLEEVIKKKVETYLWIEHHKALKRMSSQGLHKYLLENPEQLIKYHEERNNHWKNPVVDDPIYYIIKIINSNLSLMKKQRYKIIDMGCGDAKIAQEFNLETRIKFTSIDHIKINKYVTSCNMMKTPYASNKFDLAIYCLSLTWGKDLKNHIKEAGRLVKHGGYVFVICTKKEVNRIKEECGFNKSKLKIIMEEPIVKPDKTSVFTYLRFKVIKKIDIFN